MFKKLVSISFNRFPVIDRWGETPPAGTEACIRLNIFGGVALLGYGVAIRNPNDTEDVIVGQKVALERALLYAGLGRWFRRRVWNMYFEQATNAKNVKSAPVTADKIAAGTASFGASVEQL